MLILNQYLNKRRIKNYFFFFFIALIYSNNFNYCQIKSNDKIPLQSFRKSYFDSTMIFQLDKTPNTGIKLLHEENIKSSYGTKSIFISPDNEKVYTVNLEGMSIIEYDRQSRKKLREIEFIPTPGTGYDYQKRISIPSYQEKPVEACFIHNGKYLCISLHNAGGIVIWNLYNGKDSITNSSYKEAYLIDFIKRTKTKIKLPFINTGKTPKVIAETPDDRYLFVSNWHSNNVSQIM